MSPTLVAIIRSPENSLINLRPSSDLKLQLGLLIRRTSKSYLYLLGGIRLRLNLYLAQVNTFNLFSLYGLGVRYIKYRLVRH
ncbi:hypothetical protein HanPSC8_Chr12g0529911 [Helianthus annuus]|uniref:Uncharacterized protein n=1 Tax=Helianthus annuus TaxID=4232 RepID=A0A251T5I8_HELAN|nr:hypothetical protein HanPSC8_Chr12g0529911 [Helianthus annuus]